MYDEIEHTIKSWNGSIANLANHLYTKYSIPLKEAYKIINDFVDPEEK